MKKQRVTLRRGPKQFRELVEKAMGSYKFYQDLKKDPAAALQALGLQPTPQQIKALKNLNYKSLEAAANTFRSSRVI